MPDVAQPTTISLPEPQSTSANPATNHDKAQPTTVVMVQPLTVESSPSR